MAIPLPSTQATLLSEYASTSINLSRTMQSDTAGHLVPVFAVGIAYQRTDYVVDESGNKLNVIQRNQPQPTPGMPYAQDTYFGNLQLTQAQIAELGGGIPTVDLLTAISEAADALIHADLVARGIL